MAQFLSRPLPSLINDQRGNTMLMIAGMFLPILAMVGSGIDISRAYLTKARLQAACDAGVLAARKTQIGSKLTTESTAMGERYFLANFGQGAFGSYEVDFDLSDGKSGQVDGNAKAKLDTGLMQVFGEDTFNFNVTCSAIRDISNTDIMFVLDTTRSMLTVNSGDSENRFETMKQAVAEFYDQIDKSNPSDAEIRYGFVSYAANVNVGYLLERDWMVSQATYQSREPANSSGLSTRSYQDNWKRISGSESNTTYGSFAASWVPGTSGEGGSAGYYSCDGGSVPTNTLTESKTLLSTKTESFKGPPKGTRTIERYRANYNGSSFEVSLAGSNCTIKEWRTNNLVAEYDWVTDPVETKDWTYKPVTYDVSALQGRDKGGSIKAPIGDNYAEKTIDWRGCIEERQTVGTDNFDPVPPLAHDLKIDMIPSKFDPETQWRPALPGVVFYRPDLAEVTTSENWPTVEERMGADLHCPAPALRMQKMKRGDLDDYLDTLTIAAGTHHDIGMLWGARLISPNGLFAADNDGKQSRHIVFMTDGEIDVVTDHYGAYGYHWLDRRIQPNPSNKPNAAELNALVEKRFLTICQSTRARGITIWMIAFGTSLTPAMKTCSGSNRAFQAGNSAELAYAFKQIAGGISRLRLTK